MSRLFSFTGGTRGLYRVISQTTLCGEPLPAITHLDVTPGEAKDEARGEAFTLRGVTSNLRYTTASESTALKALQEPPGRANATCAALIPIRKSARWWDMPQDERRALFEEVSRHTTIGLRYLPAIARRLHHSRDLPGEAFDFLTWFDFAPQDSAAFDALLKALRQTREWDFIEREVEFRLERIAP